MPLVKDYNGDLVLLCLNGCTQEGETRGFGELLDIHITPPKNPDPQLAALMSLKYRSTMHASKVWNALMVVDPPDRKPPLTAIPQLTPAPSSQPRFSTTAGAPVQFYFCSVCGYVELYAGIIVDKKTWGY